MIVLRGGAFGEVILFLELCVKHELVPKNTMAETAYVLLLFCFSTMKDTVFVPIDFSAFCNGRAHKKAFINLGFRLSSLQNCKTYLAVLPYMT
jgi:hypothetical protein